MVNMQYHCSTVQCKETVKRMQLGLLYLFLTSSLSLSLNNSHYKELMLAKRVAEPVCRCRGYQPDMKSVMLPSKF